jgi:hypothetical protein
MLVLQELCHRQSSLLIQLGGDLGVGVCGADSRHPQADSSFFQRREFCFTLEGDIFVRYQSFKVGALARLPKLAVPAVTAGVRGDGFASTL